MRGLVRNTKPISYALYEGKAEILDLNGNRTGEYENTYSDPVTVRMSVSPASGEADWNPFGIDTPYTLIAITHDLKSPISEDSIVWVDKSINEPHNYVVKRVARSLNNIAYALDEVETRDGRS